MSVVNRVRSLRRTVWQLRNWAACGPKAVSLADQMVKSGQCIQRKWELIAMMAQVKHLRPSIVLEIGTYRGGSLRCWSSICPSSTTFVRSEEHTSELQSHSFISYAVFCLKKKKNMRTRYGSERWGRSVRQSDGRLRL